MRTTTSQRRGLQYSLRSLMLLIVAASLLLGYEVPPARLVESKTAAIRELGGDVEYEPRWSLFKHLLGGTYGQRIVKATIPGQAVRRSIPDLVALPDLRAVEVVYDGTCDLYPDLSDLAAALPERRVSATAAAVPPWEPENFAAHARLLRRIAEKIDAKIAYRLRREPWDGYAYHWDRFSRQPDPSYSYDLVTLPDGTCAELLFGNEWFALNVVDPYPWLAILLVKDRVVDCRHMNPGQPLAGVLHDFDDDGVLEFAVACRRPQGEEPPQGWQMQGDPRYWLNVFQIEPKGFRSILKRPPLEQDEADRP